MKKNNRQFLIFLIIVILFLVIGIIIYVTKNKIPIKTQTNSCQRAGCSGQLCVDINSKKTITTCEWKPEYGCYQKAICEKQKNGQCGFTQTEASKKCFSNLVPKIDIKSIQAIPTSAAK